MSIREPALQIWSSAIDEFPLCGSAAEKLAALVAFGVMAPSTHNSQPWLFRVAGDVLELRADRRRRLPIVDPDKRELIISCGAALGSIEIAMHNFGHQGDIELLPDPDTPELLARIRLGAPRATSDSDHALFRAIASRRTNRQPFLPRVLESELMSDLETIAQARGAWFRILQEDSKRLALANLIGEGDRQQMADSAFRHELASWLHHDRTSSRDGMPGAAVGFGGAQSIAFPLVVRTFDTGAGRAAHDWELALGSPVLAILGSTTDTPLDWIRTGQALIHLLLRAEMDGVAASYLNQAIEVPALRLHVKNLLAESGFPQLILRMGYPRETLGHTARREVKEVLEVTP